MTHRIFDQKILVFCVALAMWATALPRVTAAAGLLDATTSTDGAQKDSGFIPADATTHAIADDTYGRNDASGTASSRIRSDVAEGITKLLGSVSVTSTASSENQTTVSATGFAADTVTVNQRAGATGRVEIATFIRGTADGGLGHAGNGTAWGAEYRLNMTIGSGVTTYAIMVDRATTNVSSHNTDSGPVSIPVQAGAQIAFQVSESLSVTAGATGFGTANFAQCTADYSHTVYWYIIPQTPGITLTSDSGHDYAPLGGDVNLDGAVNFADLLTLAQNYGATNAVWEQGDFNHDGKVDFADLLILAQNYGQALTAAQLAQLSPSSQSDVRRAFAAVPEPASLAMLAAALPLFPTRRRS